MSALAPRRKIFIRATIAILVGQAGALAKYEELLTKLNVALMGQQGEKVAS